MSKVQILRTFVNERLTMAIEEIFVVLERTITESEDEVCRLQAENDRQRRLLDVILQPEIRLYRTGPLQISASEEGFYEQLDRSHSLGQEDDEFPLIKEELFEGPRETDFSEVTSKLLPPVKSENEDENPMYSEFSQRQPEEYQVTELRVNTSNRQMINWEFDGVLEPANNLAVDAGHLISSYYSETEDAGDDSKEVEDPHSSLNMLKSKKMQSVEGQCLSLTHDFKRPPELSQELNSTNQISTTCKICEMSFISWSSLILHVRIHKRDCGLCGTHLEPSESMKHHIQAHRTCNICSKRFDCMWGLQRHMKSHTGETPFSCPLCGKRFRQKSAVKTHMMSHTGDKPFSCKLCGKLFYVRGTLNRHMRVHTEEKPFPCAVCGKQFKDNGSLAKHRRKHGENTSACTGE